MVGQRDERAIPTGVEPGGKRMQLTVGAVTAA
jgi:hypothetical protein